MEGDALATIEKGDVIGMRLTPDRSGFAIIHRTAADEAAAAAAAAAGPEGQKGGGAAAAAARAGSE